MENALWREGCERVAGVDEVGRGPLAGPVVAGAVVLRYSRAGWVRRLRDSKQLDAAAREELAARIRRHCDYGIGVVERRWVTEGETMLRVRFQSGRSATFFASYADLDPVAGDE